MFTSNSFDDEQAVLHKEKDDDPLVTTGYVIYDVRVHCPHCKRKLCLTQYPYNDDSTEYSLAEDDLGLALFGTDKTPAKWQGLAVRYVCCKCKQKFILTNLEV